MKTALLTYDFPHRRTADFLLRMVISGYKPAAVIGATWKELKLPKSRVRVTHTFTDAFSAADVCSAFNLSYYSLDHDSPSAARLVRESQLDLGIIAGARILKGPFINAFRIGVVNIHTGWIPDNRGLTSVQSAIYKDLPMAISVHFVDERVDAGRVLGRYLVPVYSDDTLVDVWLRLLEACNLVLVPTLREIESESYTEERIPRKAPPKNRPGDAEVDTFVQANWQDYIQRWAVDVNGWRCRCGKPIPCSCGRLYVASGPLMREVPK